MQGVCVGFVFSALMEYALVNYALRAKGARKRKLSEVLKMIVVVFSSCCETVCMSLGVFLTVPHDFQYQNEKCVEANLSYFFKECYC